MIVNNTPTSFRCDCSVRFAFSAARNESATETSPRATGVAGLKCRRRKCMAKRFVRQMIRRRRFQAIWLTITFVWLTLATLVVFRTIAAGKLDPMQPVGKPFLLFSNVHEFSVA
jgi:hypothetical protein